MKFYLALIMILVEIGLLLPVMMHSELPPFLANSGLLGLMFIVYNLALLVLLFSEY